MENVICSLVRKLLNRPRLVAALCTTVYAHVTCTVFDLIAMQTEKELASMLMFSKIAKPFVKLMAKVVLIKLIALTQIWSCQRKNCETCCKWECTLCNAEKSGCNGCRNSILVSSTIAATCFAMILAVARYVTLCNIVQLVSQRCCETCGTTNSAV